MVVAECVTKRQLIRVVLLLHLAHLSLSLSFFAFWRRMQSIYLSSHASDPNSVLLVVVVVVVAVAHKKNKRKHGWCGGEES